MDLGMRQIRSAGQGSGSVEVTLPSELRDLVGLPCRVSLRDGLRPDIVLQPDLRGARLAFARLWDRLTTALLGDRAAAEAGRLPLNAFDFMLRPGARRCAGRAPVLAWLDGHALAEPPPHPPMALARSAAAFGHALAVPLGVAPDLAEEFGAAISFALTGLVGDPCWEEGCALASAALSFSGIAPGVALAVAADDAQSSGFWQASAPGVRRVLGLLRAWTADPAAHAAMRAAWRRGVTLELSGGSANGG